MVNPKVKSPNNYIVPLYMNGLQGRMLRMPSPKDKKREFLLVYGQHTTIERIFGLAEALNDFGAVTLPDLPGLGGMESFYKIGEKPTLDNMADYLAAFVKLRYRNRRFSIVAVSFGFLVATRMLQKYPDIAQRVDLLVSVAGFSHKDDFTFSAWRHLLYKRGAAIFSMRLPSIFFRNVILHPAVIRAFYRRTHNARHKFAGKTPDEVRRLVNFEIGLWRATDVRTHMKTTLWMLQIDNCQKPVNLPVWHLSVRHDNFFDKGLVEQHFRVIFNGFHDIPINANSHSASIIASKKDASPIITPKLRKILNKV